MNTVDAAFLVGSVAIVVLDHGLAAARKTSKRAKAMADRKLGNRFATEECLLGRHARCHVGCSECGNPCDCQCHGKGW